MDKLRVGWGIKARRNEEKIKRGKAGKIAECCWEEKKSMGCMDRYGKKGESFYNRNGRGIEDIVKYKERDNLEVELINREKDIQRQW